MKTRQFITMFLLILIGFMYIGYELHSIKEMEHQVLYNQLQATRDIRMDMEDIKYRNENINNNLFYANMD